MSIKRDNKRYRKKEQGAVLVELALVIPVLLGISISALELTRAVKIFKTAIQFSKESASEVYRNCADVDELGCIAQKHFQMTSYLRNLTGTNAKIIINVFEADPGGINTFTFGTSPAITNVTSPYPGVTYESFMYQPNVHSCIPAADCDANSNPTGNRTSQIIENDIIGSLNASPDPRLNLKNPITGVVEGVAGHQIMVVSEVWIPYSPLIQVIVWATMGNTDFYDVTII